MFSDEQLVQAVWNKATIVPSMNSALMRMDNCGAFIKRSEYGNRNSAYGWEMHHIIPESRNGSTTLGNLIPLQWQNNLRTADNTHLLCVIGNNR